MEPTSVTGLEPTLQESSTIEEFRENMIQRFASCLCGELERGARVAHYGVPRMMLGIDLVVNHDLSDMSKQVEYALNGATAQHPVARLRASYKVTLNTLNGQLRFTACRRPA